MSDSNRACDICVENFNKSTRKPIECNRCDLICCKQCFKTYILDPDHYLQCMGCRNEFERVDLFERLGKSFMQTTYRDIRKEIIYEREKGFLPATQAIVERILEVEHLTNLGKALDAKYDQMRKERTVPLKTFRESKVTMTVSDVLDHYHTLVANIESLDDQLVEERASIEEQINTIQQGDQPARTYIINCTRNDCKGMLSNEKTNRHGHYECALCNGVTCRECTMEIPEGKDDHECDPDILKTVKYVQSSSKPCPGCGVTIHKISGCDAMFCTSCHVSFNWKTLKITVGGLIHNPHQAEWLRQTQNRPREINDIQCGRELTFDVILATVDEATLTMRRQLDKKNRCDLKRDIDYMFGMFRVCQHHIAVTIPILMRGQFSHVTNQHLRIAFLRGFIDVPDFKKEIQQKDKLCSKKRDTLQIVVTFRDAFTDIAWECYEKRMTKTVEEWKSSINQMRKLEEYIDTCFQKIALVYGMVPKRIANM